MKPPRLPTWLALAGALLFAVPTADSYAQALAPDDPQIVGSLGAWFRDAATTFDTDTGIWADSSGNDKHAVPVGVVNVNGLREYLPPTLATISGGAFSVDDVPSLHFGAAIEDLLQAADINGGANLSELTIFVAYNVTPAGATSQTRPVGIGSVAAIQFNAGNNFNLGSDPSLRQDDGNIGPANYSAAFPAGTTFIRTARMSAAAITEWFNTNGTPQQVLNATGMSYTTSTDDFFLGDLRAGATGVPGVAGGSSARSDFDIVQTIVYTSALSDDEVARVNEWMAGNITGAGAAADLEITDLSVSEDLRTTTLTWVSRPGMNYRVEFSETLAEGSWVELSDDVTSGGTETVYDAVLTELDFPQPPPTILFRVSEFPEGG